MKLKNESERLARMVRLDQVDSLELLSARTGVPAEKLVQRWKAKPRGDAALTSGRKPKPLAHPKGTVPYSAGS